MATRKKTKVKAKTKAKVTRSTKKAAARKPVAKKPAARKKQKKTSTDPFPPMKPVEMTQQMAIAEIVGDIEERMALDRLKE